MAGNFQILFAIRSGFCLAQPPLVAAHLDKYVRLLGFPLMLTVLLCNLALLHWPVYRVLLAGQGAFYLAAILGLASPRFRHRLFALPASFVFVNWRTMLGLRDYLFGQSRPGWDKAA